MDNNTSKLIVPTVETELNYMDFVMNALTNYDDINHIAINNDIKDIVYMTAKYFDLMIFTTLVGRCYIDYDDDIDQVYSAVMASIYDSAVISIANPFSPDSDDDDDDDDDDSFMYIVETDYIPEIVSDEAIKRYGKVFFRSVLTLLCTFLEQRRNAYKSNPYVDTIYTLLIDKINENMDMVDNEFHDSIFNRVVNLIQGLLLICISIS